MEHKKLTARSMSQFSKSAKERAEIWDTETKGFYAIQLKSGISFRLKYRNAEGRQRTLTLGRYPAITPDQARELAHTTLGRVASGEDVLGTKQDAKQKAAHIQQQTLGAYLDGTYAAYQARKKSGDSTLSILRNHFKDWFNKPMGSIAPQDVRRWQAVKEAEGLRFETIKRTYGALKTCLNHAVKSCVIDSHQLTNCQLEKPHLNEQDLIDAGAGRRYLSPEETSGLFAGIEAYQAEKRQQRRNSRAHGKPWLDDLDTVAFVDHVKPWLLTMFYTGMRPGDLFGLRWEHVNLNFRTIRKTIEKTAHHQPEPRTFPLAAVLVDVLSEWHVQQDKPVSGYVFASERTGSRMSKTAMQKPWARVRALGGLPDDLDLYTLRHNFASQLILGGADLLTVSKLMAHTDIQTTVKHYGHLRPDLGRDYVDRFAAQQQGYVLNDHKPSDYRFESQ